MRRRSFLGNCWGAILAAIPQRTAPHRFWWKRDEDEPVANNGVLASDSWPGGSLAAGWSAIFGFSKCKVVVGSPNVTEPNATSTFAGQIWTGLTWPSDQASEVTAQAFTEEVGTRIDLHVRFQSGSESGYVAIVENSKVALFRDDSGSLTTLVAATSLQHNVVAGDLLTLQAAGSSIAFYQNGQRIIYFYDTTYTSGSPGFGQYSTVDITHTQVASWRGYNAVQQDGVWQKQGIVLAPNSTDLGLSPAGQGAQFASILMEGNAQILSGTVFKSWIITGWAGAVANLYYAESSDGFNWTRRGAAVLAGFVNNTVFKSGSTYYMLCQAQAANGSGTFQIFTSPDGIVWTQQSPSQTISLGGVGTWDHNAIYPGNLAAVISGTFNALYLGFNGTAWATGLITSADGINWVKSGSNPVLSGALPQAVMQVGSTYYGWFQQNQPGQGNGALDPIETYRYSSTNLTTWVKSAKSVHHSQMFEAVSNVNGYCIPAGGKLFNVGGKTYMFLNVGQGDANGPQIGQLSLAIGPTVVSGIVTQPEDAAQQVATDTFQRADGGLGANWTTLTGRSAPQIASHFVEPTSIVAGCGAFWSGAGSIGADQYSEITLHNLGAATSIALPVVRAASGATTWYQFSVNGAFGSPTTNVQAMVKWVNGVNTAIGPSVNYTPSLGDVWRMTAIGNVISVYQNGFLIAQTEDNDITTGSPGLIVFDSAAVTNAQISAWAGGNANVIPVYPSVSGGVGAVQHYAPAKSAAHQFGSHIG